MMASASDSTNVAAMSTEISYLGAFNQDELLFKVKFDNLENVPCHFTIRDEEGFVLFEQWFKGGNFSKKFLIQMQNIANANLSFSFTTEKSSSTETFLVDTTLKGQSVATRL